MEVVQASSKHHPSLTVDANGVVHCPDCEKDVKVGKGGLANYDSNHYNSKQCKKNRTSRAKAGKTTNKMAALTSWFTRTPAASIVPSTVQAPTPIISTARNHEHGSSSISETTYTRPPSPRPSVPRPKSPCPYALRLLDDVRRASLCLPDTVLEAGEGDTFAPFVDDPPVVPQNEAWEVLDRTLNNAVGWGRTAEEVVPILRRGGNGVEALCRYVEHFVLGYGVTGTLLEGKMSVLWRAMELAIKDAGGVMDHEMVARPLSPPVSLPTDDYIHSPTSSVIPDMQTQEATYPDAPVQATDSDDDITFVKTVKPIRVQSCPGHILTFPPGQTPNSSYPFMLHDQMDLPWDYQSRGPIMILRASSCTGKALDRQACRSCSELENNYNLMAIKHRIKHGVHENSPFAYHGLGGMIEVARRKGRQNDYLRFKKVNMVKKLAGRTGKISEFKQMVLALSDKRIPRLNSLLRVARRRRQSIHAIIGLIKRAAKRTYHPKDYQEEDDLQALLMLRLAGSRVADIANRIHGSPAASTIRRRTTVPPLIPSPSTPTVAEVEANVQASFQGIEKILSSMDSGAPIHAVLMWDEIATEKRLRWDDRTNKLLGIGRETAPKTTVEFNSEEDLDAVLADLECGEVRLASEATVGAIGLLHKDPRLYSARPILLSGSSKNETAEEHAKVLQTTATGVANKGELTHARTVSWASDGEGRRAKALRQLTAKRKLSPTSNIYLFLFGLVLMCFLVGDDDITADKDYKHVFKRLRNAVLRVKGIFVRGLHLTPSIIQAHLRDAGHSADHIRTLFKPDDKQDVLLAYNLLKALWSLPPASASSRPGFTETREAIRTYGDLCFHLVIPYIGVDLSLSEQLKHLSCAAHLALALYEPGDKLMPTPLFADIMIMIKNVYFCVAKAKADHPHDPFFIILLGTDRLETLFGILRTMVGNDANLDILQLSLRATGTTEIANILALHPEWDKAPRRLHLPRLSKDMEPVAESADHTNPGAWRGDVIPFIVSLIVCWKLGRRMIEEDYPWAADVLKHVETIPGANILAPRGVPLFSLPLSDDDLEDDEAEDAGGEFATDIPSGRETEDTMDGLRELEDAAAEVDLSFGDQGQPGGLPTFSRTISVGGIIMNKARALAQRFKYKKSAASTDRLRRVKDEGRYVSSVDNDDNDAENEGPQLAIHDPIASLLCCEGKLWLSLGEVNNISVHSKPADSVAVSLLPEKAVVISYQCIRLIRTTLEEDPTALNDWRSSSFLPVTIKVSGLLVQPLNPAILTHTPGKPCYLFDSGMLLALAADLRDGLTKAQLKAIPHTARTPEFPYRERTGEACFIAEGDGEDQDIPPNMCSKCNLELDFSQAQQVLTHFAMHLRHDPTIDKSEETCGTCLRSSALGICEYYLKKGKGANAGFSIDLARTTCINKLTFRYRVAAESSESSPSSNVPLECKICGPTRPAVWRYSMEAHFKHHHPLSVSLPTYSAVWTLSNFEKSAIRELWKVRKTVASKKKGKGKELVPLVVSKAHSSRLAFRDLADESEGEEGSGEEVADAVEVGEEEVVQEEGEDTIDETETDGGGGHSDEQRLEGKVRHEVEEGSASGEDDDGGIVEGGTEVDMQRGSLGSIGGGRRDETSRQVERAGSERNIDDENNEQGIRGARSNGQPIPAHNHQPRLDEGLNVSTTLRSDTGTATNSTPQHAEIQSTRGTRKRKDISHLADCLCGSRVSGDEIARAEDVVHCRKVGCETKWYHLACVGGLEFAPKGWICESCSTAETARKRRRH